MHCCPFQRVEHKACRLIVDKKENVPPISLDMLVDICPHIEKQMLTNERATKIDIFHRLGPLLHPTNIHYIH